MHEDLEGASARLIRRARVSAGLSQAELGLRAHVTQSVVSAYENGHRQPSLPTLGRLVAATGTRLVVEIDASRVLPDTVRGRLLRRLAPHLRAVVARHGASNPRVFGSVARGTDDEDSDIDLLVDTPEGLSLPSLVALRRDLAQIVGQPVDLVPLRSLRRDVAAAAERQAVPL